jgi:hypothetical protein
VDGGWNLRWRQLDVRLTVSVFVFCVHVCESFASWSLAGKRDQGVCFYNGQESGDKTLGHGSRCSEIESKGMEEQFNV